MKNINFSLDTSKNYSEVQSQINSIIQSHLNVDEYSSTLGKNAENALNFSLFIRNKADIVMSHGVADKNYLWIVSKDGERLVNDLKAVFVPGNWLKRRLLKSKKITLSEEQIITVGWPRLDLLRQLQLNIAQKGSDLLQILWAPTHDRAKRGVEQISTSSYPDFQQHMESLAVEFNIDSSLHPRNRVDKTPTVEKLLRSDVIISDFGTMVYEAWALKKPVIFPRWILRDSIQQYLPNSAEAYIFNNRIGYHPDSYDEMVDMLRSGPVISEAVDVFMNDYLDNYAGGISGLNVANALRFFAGKLN